MRLNHVALTVIDREASAAFYATHFGLDQRIHEDDLLIVSAGDGALPAPEPAAGRTRTPP